MILDQHGRTITSTKPPERGVSVLGVRDRWSSYPSNNLTPERLAAIFREADQGDLLRQSELFEEMIEKDAHLATVFQTRALALLSLDWNIEPVSEDAKDKAIADHFREWWEGFDTYDLIIDLADAVPKGVSFVAPAWVKTSQGFTVNETQWIHQKHWRLDDESNAFKFYDLAHPQGEIPAFGAVVEHRHKSRSGSPSRAGVLRTCAWLYLFKNYAVKDWVAFAEVYGQPVRIGKYDPSTSKEEREALELAVSMIGSDAAGIISKSTEIEILEAAKSASVDVYKVLTEFCEAGQSKAVLGQTLTTSEGQHGTQALGKVHNDVRGDILQADAKQLCKTLQSQLLKPWVIFNYGFDYAERQRKRDEHIRQDQPVSVLPFHRGRVL